MSDATNTTPEAHDEPTVTVVLTDRQRSLVLSALFEKGMETKRYVQNTKVSDEPGPTDTCCDAHLQRWKRDHDMHESLKGRRRAEKELIKLFEIEGE